MLRLDILTIGDELLDGRVLNSNLRFISERFQVFGVACRSALTVTDKPDDIKTALGQFFGVSDILIITGGLGPTEDDRTTAVVSEFLGEPLKEDPQTIDAIKTFFEGVGKPVFDSNLKQAYFPASAMVIPNTVGTAPGFYLEARSTLCIVLPGVPREMASMLESVVLPLCKERFSDQLIELKTRNWACFGLGESEIADRLQGIYPLPEGVELGFRAHFPEVHLILKGPNLIAHQDGLDLQIESALKGHIVARGQDTFLGNLAQKLLTEKSTISVAESCTGGVCSGLLTSMPGSSDYFKQAVITYSNESKQALLGVDNGTLETYGAVSGECAQEMLEGLLEQTGTDFGVAITGIAGPDGGTDEKPVGTVYIGVSAHGKHAVYQHCFSGDRERIRLKAAYYALFYVLI